MNTDKEADKEADKEFIFKYLNALSYKKGKGDYHDYERVKKCFLTCQNYEEICKWISEYLGV